jgi:HlyD family secretion protein
MKTAIRDTSAQDIAREPVAKRYRYLKAGAIAAGFLVGFIYLFSAIGNWLGTELTVSSERIRTATVVRGEFIRDVNVQGRIVAAISPTLYSTAGGIVTLEVQPGNPVTVGQRLATIESPEIQSEHEQALSQLAGLQSELERERIQARQAQVKSQQTIDLARVKLTAAEREMRRAEQSIKIKAISDIDYERYRDDLATARVEFNHASQDAVLEKESLEFEIRTRQLSVEQQELVVNNLERRVDDLVINSPVSGIVGNVAIVQKAVVGPNEPLITVVDLTAFEVEVRIPEAYADDLGIGMPGEVLYNGQSYAGELTSLSPEVINSEVTGRIRFAADAPAGLRQNQRVTARVVMDHFDNVLKLQRGSFTDSGGGRIAFVLTDDGIASKRSIELGVRSVAEVEVVAGLQEGERVIISSIADYQDMDTIQVVD